MVEERESARYRLLYDLGCAFASRTDLDELLPLIIAKCREALEAEGAAVLLIDRLRNEFYFPYISDTDKEVARRLEAMRFRADLGIAGVAVTSRRPLRIDDAQSDPRFYHGADKVSGLTTRNLVAVPLLSQQGALGVVEVVNRKGQYAFSDEDVRFLEALSGSIAIAIENAQLYQQMRQSEAKLRTQVGTLRRDLAREQRFEEIVGNSAAISQVYKLMDTAAASSITVLIQGETGTGKELVARGIHRGSARADAPFLAINCAAMPETLLESELFGHRKGSFTGALRDNPGLFRSASGGTVFLDEVGNMPLSMQAKLLRVLEEEEVVPIGDSFPSKVDVRVLSATNRDLREEVKRGTFREDLYYRLAVFPIHVPPLRERIDDIPLLAQFFLHRACEREHKHLMGFDEPALAVLANHGWPGNVRELQNEIERAVALAREGDVVGVSHLSPELSTETALASVAEGVTESGAISDLAPGALVSNAISDAMGFDSILFRQARAEFEARFITRMLERTSGNVSRAARQMGMSRVQLQRKLKEYHLR